MDALTTANQNQAVALNSITQALQYVTGQYTSKTFSGPTTQEISQSSGRLVNVIITSSGSGEVKFYNTASKGSILAENLIYVLPASTAVGVTTIGAQFANGLVMDVGAGTSANVTYSVSV